MSDLAGAANRIDGGFRTAFQPHDITLSYVTYYSALTELDSGYTRNAHLRLSRIVSPETTLISANLNSLNSSAMAIVGCMSALNRRRVKPTTSFKNGATVRDLPSWVTAGGGSLRHGTG